MNRSVSMLLVFLLGLTGCTRGAAEGLAEAEQTLPRPAGTLHDGPAFRFTEITDGIYHARGTGALNVGTNSVVIINESDVMLVDSHITAAAAWVLLDELKTITDKPVRYVVNTHYHFDHAHGNQIFPADVEVIGHVFTREKLEGNVLEERTFQSFTSGIPGQIEFLKQQIADESDAQARSPLEGRLRVQENYWAALQEVVPTPPNVTLERQMTLYRGGREIQLHFLGRGHTGGDVVVYLPEERIVCTGDLLGPNPSFMGDGYLNEWVETLDALAKLDFVTALPGHGAPVEGKAKIEHYKSYLTDLWNQLRRLHSAGVSAQDAAGRVDLTAHSRFYPNIQGPGVDPRAVLRVYDLLNGEAE